MMGVPCENPGKLPDQEAKRNSRLKRKREDEVIRKSEHSVIR
jgi:hypothetical protein